VHRLDEVIVAGHRRAQTFGMGHEYKNRCDFIDVLEESVTTGRPVSVTLRGGQHFNDHVRDVVTERGEDFAIFRDHERIAVTDISSCVRGEAP
jgi:hypothetical protein